MPMKRTSDRALSARKNCRHCHEPIAIGAFDRHEKMCANRTPEERVKATQTRAYYYHHIQLPVPTNGKPVARRAYKKSGLFVGRGRLKSVKNGRLAVQLSVPMAIALSVIRELVPHVQIDRVGVE